jgi:diguanylate cyclase (GGDEF)-like protein
MRPAAGAKGGPPIHDKDLTAAVTADIRRGEFVFRLLVTLVFVLLVHLDHLLGGPQEGIRLLPLYILSFVYIAFACLVYFFRPELGPTGKLWWLGGLVDISAVCLAIHFGGGVNSFTYLFLAIIPLAGGMHHGNWAALAAGALCMAGYSLVVLLDTNVPAGFDYTRALVFRYAYIAAATAVDIYISDLVNRDRRRLRIFFDITKSSSSSPALYNVLDEITRRLADILKAEAVLVFLYNEENHLLEAQQPYLGLEGLTLTRMRFYEHDPGLAPWCFRSGEPLLVTRSRRSDEEIFPFPLPLDILDLLAAPLTARGKKIGLLIVANKMSRRGFNRRDLSLLQLLSPHLAVFVDNAVLFRRSEEKVAQLTSLIRVVDAIGTVSSLDQLYNLAMDVIRGLFAVEKALINIIDPGTGMLHTVRSFGFSEEFREQHLGHPFKAVKNCYVLKNDAAFLCKDIAKEHECPNLVVEEGTRSVLCVPVRSGSRIFGIIHMASRFAEAFDEEDKILANAIGEQLGMAVERARLFEEISRLAITDELTGLYNMRYLKRVLAEEVRRALRYHRPLSFIMLDIDYFKFYNDRHGHVRGDDALKRLATLLKLNTRDVDTVCRYGGEEFCIVIPEVPKHVAYSMAERLRRTIQDYVFPYEDEQPGKDFTVSMGVAGLPQDATEADALIEKADLALYRAKQTGRNRVCLYTPDLDLQVHPGLPAPPGAEAEKDEEGQDFQAG